MEKRATDYNLALKWEKINRKSDKIIREGIMNCPKCKNDHSRKDGIVKGKQRYKCKDCSN